MENHKEAYINFCKEEFDLPLFSQAWYLDAVCGTNGWDILLAKKGNEIAATMPIPKSKNIWGFQVSRMPILTKYLGPHFSKKYRNTKHEEKLLKELISQIPSHHFFQHTLNPAFKNWLPFFWKEFEGSTRCTFILNLDEELETLYSNIAADYRNNKIPKIENTIRITSDRSLQEFYDVRMQTFKRKKMSNPFTFKFFKNYDAVLAQKNARKIFFAVDENNQIHSVVYLIWDNHTAYFHMAGDDNRFRNSGASILLTWHAIKFAKEMLFKKVFDFEGSMIPSIEKVRRDFGAVLNPYFQIQKFSSKSIRFIYHLKY